MGNLCSTFRNVCTFSSLPPSKVLFLGLDEAGKTSILYRLKGDNTMEITPTIGFNVETIRVTSSVTFTIWDVRGDFKVRPLWKQYFPDCEGVVFIVDAANPSRFSEVKKELEWILKSEEIAEIPFILLINKQDLPDAVTPADAVKSLGLYKMKRWKILVRGTSAHTGEGLTKVLQDLSRMVNDSMHTKEVF